MKVIDLTEEYLDTYYFCLEDWSSEMKESGNHKEKWHCQMKDKGHRVKLAIEDDKAAGMIQYIPIEQSFIDGHDLYFIHCIWVHGYKKGIGNHQKRGLGKALLQAAEEDAKSRGAQGIAAWGISMPFWMKASWFKKQGYTKVDKIGMQVLLWKPFTDDAEPPKWIKEKKKPESIPGKVTVSSFLNGWCPAQNLVYERAKRAAAEFDDKVSFEEINSFDEDVFSEWGIVDGLFIDGKRIRTGPPPSYKKIRKKIDKKVKRL